MLYFHQREQNGDETSSHACCEINKINELVNKSHLLPKPIEFLREKSVPVSCNFSAEHIPTFTTTVVVTIFIPQFAVAIISHMMSFNFMAVIINWTHKIHFRSSTLFL